MRSPLNLLSDKAQGALAYRQALGHVDEHERVDACGPDWVEPGAAEGTYTSAEAVAALLNAKREGEPIPGGGKVLKEIRGMGKVYDWRTSPWTPANGGRIHPLIFVHHIPVVPNRPGIEDFITLRNVLVAQGLMVQTATDREGNVALYTPFDILCYHARGANQQSTGCEHMHATTSEAWTRRQMRAAAWLVQLAERKDGIPGTHGANLDAGPGIVKVVRKGQATHEGVSKKAGYNDRSDPGPGFDWGYLYHCVDYFKRNGHFANA